MVLGSPASQHVTRLEAWCLLRAGTMLMSACPWISSECGQRVWAGTAAGPAQLFNSAPVLPNSVCFAPLDRDWSAQGRGAVALLGLRQGTQSWTAPAVYNLWDLPTLPLGRKGETKPGSVLKSSLITAWPTEVPAVRALVFPVVTYGCERWTMKIWAGRIDAFELWCWRRLLRVLGLQGDPTSPS